MDLSSPARCRETGFSCSSDIQFVSCRAYEGLVKKFWIFACRSVIIQSSVSDSQNGDAETSDTWHLSFQIKLEPFQQNIWSCLTDDRLTGLSSSAFKFKIWISSSIFHPQTAFDARARYTVSPCLFEHTGKPYLALSRIPLNVKMNFSSSTYFYPQISFQRWWSNTATVCICILVMFSWSSCHVWVKINSFLIFSLNL